MTKDWQTPPPAPAPVAGVDLPPLRPHWVPTRPSAPPPPPPAPQRRGGLLPGLLAGLASVLVVALLLAVVWTRRGEAPTAPAVTVTATTTTTLAPEPSPSTVAPSTPTPNPPATPRDRNEPGARGWPLPARDWDDLPRPSPRSRDWKAVQYNVIHAVAPPTLQGCPKPQITSTKQAYRDAVLAQWRCVHRAWLPVLAELGLPTVEPQVKFFPGKGSSSACGYLQAPAFYCGRGPGVVYFGGAHFEMAQSWHLSINEMVNHEYGHHLQALAGITAAKLRLPRTADLERRSELQAICFSAMTTYHNTSVEFGRATLDSWLERLNTMAEDDNHGHRAAMQYWGTRGLYAKSLNDCNTWVVSSTKVA